MSDELSAARRVLSRLSPAAFVAALTEAERAQLLDALMRDAGMKVSMLHGGRVCSVRNGGHTPIVVAYSQPEREQVVYQDVVAPPASPASPHPATGGGALHWVPAWGELREVHALDADVTACGLSLRPGQHRRQRPPSDAPKSRSLVAYRLIALPAPEL